MSSVRTATTPDVDPDVKPENEWTIMIFFAGDPHLSPTMTAQIKSIKDAGFQENTTVLVHYDPNERGVATTTLDINCQRKADLQKHGQRGTRIGDGKDPFVRNFLEDSIKGPAKSATAVEALKTFLKIGFERRAKHYLIFLVGHGVVVGNDFFLPDKQPDTGISLTQLGEVLVDFKNGVKLFDGEVELIGLHSCSMSAIEVAYQLKGAGKYLMATEGASFVTSWPYRQLVKKMLNTIDDAKDKGINVDVVKLVNSIQQLSLHNSTDFMFSGLSADLCLCSLQPEKINELTVPIQNLTTALKAGLRDPRALELITMAHLKAQSYWQETYTDLYDFCLCLEPKCDSTNAIQAEMKKACTDVKNKLAESPDNLVVQSDFFGPLFQYSHGLSIFFPWSEPIDDGLGDDMLARYKNYTFTTELKQDSWLSFLKDYFEITRRFSREEEDGSIKVARNGTKLSTSIIPGANGTTGATFITDRGEALAKPEKASPALEKASPSLDMGCTCSIKNIPMKFFRSPRTLEDPNPQVTSAANGKPAPVTASTVKRS
jgi:hypothetical protein